MVKIALVTIAYTPPLNEAVILRAYYSTAPYNDNVVGNLLAEFEGTYDTDRWTFEVDDDVAQRANLMRFQLSPVEIARCLLNNPQTTDAEYHLSGFEPWQWTRLGPVPERGQAHNKDFDLPSTSEEEYEVIVIGSGMAGGVLADRLSDSGIRTLVLEAGGCPLETHIANLPRRNKPGFQKHIWERWFDFRVKNCDSGGPDNQYTDGYQGFNLGGRSVFWGGFIPRMTSDELDYWPRQLKWDLEDRYYQLAEEVMGRSTAPTTEYTRSIHRLLRDEFREFSHFDAPVAIQKNTVSANTISPGVFSTADTLLESHRSRDYDEPNNLTIRTHQLAIDVKPGEPTVVTTRDIATGQLNEFRGVYVVFACGTVESARLAKRSNLGNELVGTGVTDHPVAFTHFEISPYRIFDRVNELNHEVIPTPYYDRYGSVKVVSQRKPREEQTGLFNMLLELGADFNQGRYLDPDIYLQSVRKRSMLCEVVFLTNLELVLDNRIEFDPDNNYRPIAHVRNPGLAPEFEEELRALRDRVLDNLDGEILNQGWGDGSLGFVAHEVGSLHMEVPSSNDPNDIRSSNNISQGKQKALQGVVDLNGKFLDQDFIYACDLSIFPTSPAANPSLTAVALAIRLGDHLVDQLR